jgi:hypothetical protein
MDKGLMPFVTPNSLFLFARRRSALRRFLPSGFKTTAIE